MSTLQKHSRTIVEFDPWIKSHREWAAEFFKTGSWRHCPYQFFTVESTEITAAAIQRILLKYYTDDEFGENTLD